jgi:hypothetical protein
MTELHDPHNFEKVCVNTVLESLREGGPLFGPRTYHLCFRKTQELSTSFRYLLVTILMEHREELVPHLRGLVRTLTDEPERAALLWGLVQTFLHALLTPLTVRRLVEDPGADVDWLAEEMACLTRSCFPMART